MNVSIQMIGTGNAFAKKYYNNNAILYDGDKKLLIDCGITAPMALHQLGIKYNELDGILITHLHADHVGGLEELAFQLKFIYNIVPKLYVPETLIQPLWENSLRGGLEQDGFHSLDSYFDVVQLQEQQPIQVFDGLKLEIMETLHIPNRPSYSLVLNDLLFYSADVQFSLELLNEIHLNRHIPYIFHDCQLKSPGVVHACIEDLLTLPEEIQRKMFLMHYDDHIDEFRGSTGAMTIVNQHEIMRFSSTR